jgi:hypothetical protein
MTNLEITNEAVSRVEENNKEYAQRLFLFAETWVKTQMKPFTCDDLKEAFYKAGNLPPRQPSVFGAPFRKLSKHKLIFDTQRTIKSKNPLAHDRPLRVWISKEYAIKQQTNAKINHQTLNIFDNNGGN